jgi:hypothetical protein
MIMIVTLVPLIQVFQHVFGMARSIRIFSLSIAASMRFDTKRNVLGRYSFTVLATTWLLSFRIQ